MVMFDMFRVNGGANSEHLHYILTYILTHIKYNQKKIKDLVLICCVLVLLHLIKSSSGNSCYCSSVRGNIKL